MCFGVALAEDLLCTHKSHTNSSHKEKAKRDLSWVAWYRLREQLLKTSQISTISANKSILLTYNSLDTLCARFVQGKQR